MRIYFVRHGESLGNVGGEPDQSRVGLLSARGHEQAERLSSRLDKYEFNDILVSPLERAVRTILPYLKKTGRTAEIWPELAEAPCRATPGNRVPAAIRYGDAVRLPEDARPHFRMRDDEPARLMPPSDESYGEGQRRVALAAQRLMAVHGGRETVLLVVGHACSGARFIEAFMDIPQDGRFAHRNTGITCIEQISNGKFVMRFANRVSEEGEA